MVVIPCDNVNHEHLSAIASMEIVNPHWMKVRLLRREEIRDPDI